MEGPCNEALSYQVDVEEVIMNGKLDFKKLPITWEFLIAIGAIFLLGVGMNGYFESKIAERTRHFDAKLIERDGQQQEYFGKLIMGFSQQIGDVKKEVKYLRIHVEDNGQKIARIEGRLERMASLDNIKLVKIDNK